MSIGWRAATAADLDGLAVLEERTNLVALAEVFPPERFPFPSQAVRDRWAATLADPAVTIEVVDLEDGSGLLAYLAFDAVRLRHLGVHPQRWGAGLGRAGIARALTAMRAAGAPQALLWCLAENTRARRLYESLGWRLTGVEQQTPWPPRPMELEYARRL